jgi:hypothetical protein
MPYNVSDTGPAAYALQQQQMGDEKTANLIKLLLTLKQTQTAQNQWQSEQGLRQQEFGLNQQQADWQKQYQTGELGVRRELAGQEAQDKAFHQGLGIADLNLRQKANETTAQYQNRLAAAREQANVISGQREADTVSRDKDKAFNAAVDNTNSHFDAAKERTVRAFEAQESDPVKAFLTKSGLTGVSGATGADQKKAALDAIEQRRSDALGRVNELYGKKKPSAPVADPFDAAPIGSTRTSPSTHITQKKTAQGWVNI